LEQLCRLVAKDLRYTASMSRMTTTSRFLWPIERGRLLGWTTGIRCAVAKTFKTGPAWYLHFGEKSRSFNFFRVYAFSLENLFNSRGRGDSKLAAGLPFFYPRLWRRR
jgi:hypothetical protein